MYTFSIPAATMGSGKGVRFKVRWKCSTCTSANKIYKWVFGGTTLSYAAVSATSTSLNYTSIDIYNNPGSTTAQTMTDDMLFNGGSNVTGLSGTAAENTANAITVNFVANAAATETFTPIIFTGELIQ
jgi:hypothetical protein